MNEGAAETPKETAAPKDNESPLIHFRCFSCVKSALRVALITGMSLVSNVGVTFAFQMFLVFCFTHAANLVEAVRKEFPLSCCTCHITCPPLPLKRYAEHGQQQTSSTRLDNSSDAPGAYHGMLGED